MLSRFKTLLLENRGVKQTVLKNFFWLTAAQIASRFIRAAVIIYAARVLGAEGYGVFSYALGLAGFFTIFADIGIGMILTREAAKKPDQRSYYFATSLILKLLLLLITALAVLLIAPSLSKIEAAKALIPIIALLTVFDGIRDLSISFLRALEKMEVEAFIIILMNLAIAVTGFIVLSRVATPQAFALSYVASAGAGTLAAVVILRKEFAKVFSHFRKELAKQIINAALPIAFIALLGALTFNVDLIMLGWWRTAAEIGFYSSAQRIVQLLTTLPAIIASATFPTLSRLVGQGKESEVASLMERGITTLLLVAIPLTVGGAILATPIIDLVYGHAYAPAASVLQILIVTMLFFPSALIVNMVLSYDKQKSVAKFIALAGVANVLLNFFLIPPLGIVGAATATLISQGLSITLIWTLMKKVNNFHTIRYLKKIALAAVVMGVVSFSLNKLGLQVLVNIAISAAAYFALLLFLKEGTIKEGVVMAKRALQR